MGISISNSNTVAECGVASKEACLRLPITTVKKAVHSYYTYQISPILDENGYKFFMMLAFSELDNELASQASQTLWNIFSTQDNMSCCCQEILVCIILLATSDDFSGDDLKSRRIAKKVWSDKFSLLFDVFKCMGNEEMAREDMLYCADILITSLCRLWDYFSQEELPNCDNGAIIVQDSFGTDRNVECSSEEWTADKMRLLTEELVDRGYLKMEKDLEEMIPKKVFLQWSLEKFHISDPEEHQAEDTGAITDNGNGDDSSAGTGLGNYSLSLSDESDEEIPYEAVQIRNLSDLEKVMLEH